MPRKSTKTNEENNINTTKEVKLKATKLKSKSHQNRGMGWEELINNKLLEYREKGLCFIQKIPTEFVIIRGIGGKINSAFPKKQTESCDFLGAKQYLPVGLEAKETKNKGSFPLANIEPHQIKFFDNWCGTQGVGFYFIRFSILERMFFVEASILNNEIKTREKKEVQERGDKSLTVEWFEQNSIEIGKDLEFIQYIK